LTAILMMGKKKSCYSYLHHQCSRAQSSSCQQENVQNFIFLGNIHGGKKLERMIPFCRFDVGYFRCIVTSNCCSTCRRPF